MKIRIGSLEVSDVTLDELDQLVQRYGGGVTVPVDPRVLDTPEPPLLAQSGAIIGGQKMTAKDVKALRERLAKPSPLPGIDNG